MTRLSPGTLDRLPSCIARPEYDRAAVETGIVHIGLGAFHRAHQAVYSDDVLQSGDLRWGIAGVSLRSPATRDALAPQGHLYTLAVRHGGGERLRVIGALTDSLVAPEDPSAVVERLVRPTVRVVTVTVTEKGYCHLPATGELDEAHPEILHDLQRPEAPKTFAGFLVEALRRRREAGVAPFTVLSCDNLPENGMVTKRVLSRFATLRDPSLGGWLADAVACPSSMVDRIVPATTDADRAAVSARLGLDDAWPVMAEPFCQWVFEDDFPIGRPAWESTGAQPVADVRPYEAMKLRLLNASHSCIAYLGYLGGYETVADAMADPRFAGFVRRFMDEEATTTLKMPPGAALDSYKSALIERFRNPALKHRTWQIAMDGTQKLPQRLLGTARDRLAAGAPIDRIALGVAGWMRYVTGIDEKGQPIDVRDPLAAKLAAIAKDAGPVAERLAPELMAVREVFGEDLPANPAFVRPVTAALAMLFEAGAARAVATL